MRKPEPAGVSRVERSTSALTHTQTPRPQENQRAEPPGVAHRDLLVLSKEELAKRLRYELERVADLREECFRLRTELDLARWQAAGEGRC